MSYPQVIPMLSTISFCLQKGLSVQLSIFKKGSYPQKNARLLLIIKELYITNNKEHLNFIISSKKNFLSFFFASGKLGKRFLCMQKQ